MQYDPRHAAKDAELNARDQLKAQFDADEAVRNMAWRSHGDSRFTRYDETLACNPDADTALRRAITRTQEIAKLLEECGFALQESLTRIHGPQPEEGSTLGQKIATPARSGEVGELNDALDRLDDLARRALGFAGLFHRL